MNRPLHPDEIYDRRVTASGVTIFSFDLAVDNGYFDRSRNRWISRTRFQPATTYRTPAENTLTKRMALTVTGKLLDDSLSPDGSAYIVHRDKLEALDIAVSLRFATRPDPLTSPAPLPGHPPCTGATPRLRLDTADPPDIERSS